MAPSFFTKVLGEFLGCMLLVLSVFVSGGNAVVIGLTLAFIVFLIGPISGAAVNPAIAFASFVKGDLDQQTTVSFILAEFLGGLAATWAYIKLA
jgi:aquaporin Z